MKNINKELEQLYSMINESQAEPGYAKARARAADDMAHYGDGTPESNPDAHQRLSTGVNPELYKLTIHPGGGGEVTVAISGKHAEVQISGQQIHFKNRAALTQEEQRAVMGYLQKNKVIKAAFSHSSIDK